MNSQLRQTLCSLLYITLTFLLSANPALATEIQVTAPSIVHSGEPFTIAVQPVKTIPLLEPRSAVIRTDDKLQSRFTLSGEPVSIDDIVIEKTGETRIIIEADNEIIADIPVQAIPGWYSLLPPMVAIGLALWLRSVIPAIFLGVWIGAIAREGFTITGFVMGLINAFQIDVLNAIANPDHVAVILFTCMIGGMVGILSKNGGMQGVVNLVIRWANTPRRGQISVWFLGLCIFFDDYTNTLVVGNAVRPVTDKLRISREKLAYIVDSTAAPVACIALITTWIGYEVGLIGKAIENLNGLNEGAYSIFLNSIPYSFYPVLAIIFVYLVAISGRDFGPMLVAERRSLSTGEVAPPPNQSAIPMDRNGSLNVSIPDGMPIRAVNAIAPIIALVASSAAGLYCTGEGATIQQILGTADAYHALVIGSLMGVVTAVILTMGQSILSLHDVVAAWTQGVTVMATCLIILILAWAMSDITDLLGTADFLVRLGGESLPPATVPAWAFILAAVTAFATGSSWGAMAILLPLLVPFAWATLINSGGINPDNIHIIYSTIACILSGAVWGDHCSPISDTTILSSLSSSCDHIEHVRTQLPYALTVGAVALVCGTIPTAYGLPVWIAFPCGIITLVLLLRYFGSSTQDCGVTDCTNSS